MQQAINGFYRFLELLLVILLAGMVIMVFGNVTLRYVFNSGWTVSEEFSRFFFVWLTFVGAVVAFREYSHMGIETLVLRLSRKGRLLCLGVGNLIIMGCSFIFAWGAWSNWRSTPPCGRPSAACRCRGCTASASSRAEPCSLWRATVAGPRYPAG